MIKRVVITNYLGETMEYKIDGVEVDNPSGLIITSIEGLGPAKANINMTDLATTDGQLFNSARLNGRNIVIKALFTSATSIEQARLLSYKYFPIKKKLTFLIETDYRTAKTEGYVESNEPDIFSEASSCQISVLCEEPYFDGGKVSWKFSDTIPLMKFAVGNESLDEPLIKVSENADPSEVNKLDYNGDADTGVEMKFELGPTDDIMDSFRVTKIEITKDGNKTMVLDMSKMKRLVPDTTYNLAGLTCYKGYDDPRYKLFDALFPNTMLSGTDDSFMVNYNGELHLICGKHYKFDNGEQWVEVGTIPYDMTGSGSVLVYNNKIHMMGGNIYPKGHYVWDDVNGWKTAPVSLPFDLVSRATAIVYNGNIHLFGGATNDDFKYALHYRWDDISSEWIKYDGHLPGRISNKYDAIFIEFKGQIHYLNLRDNEHFVWDDTNNVWEKIGNLDYAYWGDSFRAIVYKNRIHLYITRVESFFVGKHFAFDGSSWEMLENAPTYMYNLGSHAIAILNDIVYFVGTCDLFPPANNICLIENDQLIVSTIKGKKSVTLLRGTNKYNVLNVLEKNPTWFELKRGANYFAYSAEGGSEDELTLTITTNQLYEGV